MTLDELLADAARQVDAMITDQERANLTSMLVGDVDVDSIDVVTAFNEQMIGTWRASVLAQLERALSAHAETTETPNGE